jgi:hypothetical protein
VKEGKEAATKRLIDTCRSEVTRISQENGDKEDAAREAKMYLELLREMLPNAAENGELGKILGGAAEARAVAESEIKRRHDLLEQRAVESTATLKGKYEAYRTERKPESPGADTVLESIDQWKGKYISFTHEMLGSGAYDWFDDSKGEVWSIKIPPDLQKTMLANMKKMDDLVRQIAEKILTGAGFPASQADRYIWGHYFADTEILCEVTGKAIYTPTHVVRDSGGNIVGTISGTPYSVPEVTLRAVKSTRYVIVPGAGNSLDSIKLEGVIP